MGIFKKEEKSTKKTNVEELKELLLNDTNTVEDGILTLAKKQFTSDLHVKKIARIIEILNELK